ncbi:MAG: hypothetical protein KJO67_14055, partial [Silicimonas sp.]|nr:hypothetical protein [Silicimonas sp.]
MIELSSVRHAMSSANSSIDTPALTWRTFDWLSISLLMGMSREALRVIFCCVGLTGYLRDRPAGSLSPDLQTRHGKPGNPLTLLTPVASACRSSARYVDRPTISYCLPVVRFARAADKQHGMLGRSCYTGFRPA